jgi:hypothetical protein
VRARIATFVIPGREQANTEERPAMRVRIGPNNVLDSVL